MNKRSFSIVSLILFPMISLGFPLFCDQKAESDPIVVCLSTENPRLPLYLAKFADDGSGFDPIYKQQLEEILGFDLNHNGMTYTLPQTSEKEKEANRLLVEELGNVKEWKNSDVFYVLKLSIKKDKRLSATMLSVNEQSIKSIESQPLTGELSKDRRQVHLVADTIHKTLFGKEGIATTKILYTVKKKKAEGCLQWTSDVWECDYDGANARMVMANAGYVVTPIYIPPKPGSLIGSFIYISYKSAQPKIFVASLKEGIGSRLTYLRGNQLTPAISRQRDKIAFISDVTGNPDLFLQPFSPESGAIGKPQQIFSAPRATQGTPTFSPDGKQLAFVSNKDGSPRIYLITIPNPGTPLKDLKATLITKYNRESTAPTWSPDGSKIAYCSNTKGVRQIWIYDFEKKEERQLTQGASNKENPSWAPNSLHLIFNSSDTNDCELYMINLNESHATKITSGVGEKRFPSWEPRSY